MGFFEGFNRPIALSVILLKLRQSDRHDVLRLTVGPSGQALLGTCRGLGWGRGVSRGTEHREPEPIGAAGDGRMLSEFERETGKPKT